MYLATLTGFSLYFLPGFEFSVPLGDWNSADSVRKPFPHGHANSLATLPFGELPCGGPCAVGETPGGPHQCS